MSTSPDPRRPAPLPERKVDLIKTTVAPPWARDVQEERAPLPPGKGPVAIGVERLERARVEAGGRGTVFLVDDDESLRRATTRLLGTVGFDVHAYASAEEFLAAFDPARPGCLLLDVRMPGRSGIELQGWLSGLRHAPPVVFLTGHADPQSKARALAQGAVGFLEKPCAEVELLEMLQRALEVDAARRGR